MGTWTIRQFNEHDINKFLDWRKNVARREKTREYFEWEYFKGPWGPVETFLAVDAENIVGQYSAQRYETFYLGKKIMASLAFDAGTHPDYRKQGIFEALGNKILSEEGKQNILFTTGFPNEFAIPGHKKVGWCFLCQLPLLINNNISEIRVDNPSIYEIVKIESFGKEFEGFSENFKDDLPIYLNRTRRYLNWRFVEKPGLKYQKFEILDKSGELISYFVIKYFQSEGRTILHLLDFLFPHDEEVYKAVLNHLIKISKEQNITTISMFLSRNNSLSAFLRNFQFEYTNSNRFYIVHNNTNILDENKLFEEKNHFFTMGDSDVF